LDVTDFKHNHPGGKVVFQNMTDISKYFYGGYAYTGLKAHKHSNYAKLIVN